MSETTLNAVIQRLNHLEWELRWWKTLASTFLALLGLVFLLGAVRERDTKMFDEIRARQFVLVDANGNVRAGLGVGTDGSAALAFADLEGKIRTGLAVLPDGSPRLRFYGKDGRARGGLGVSPDGSIALALADKEGALLLWSIGKEIVQIPVEGQRFLKPVTAFTTRSASPEDYRPADAELLTSMQWRDYP